MTVKETIKFGVAINDADYYVTKRLENGKSWQCPIYRTWSNMLTRVLCDKYHVKHPQYKEVGIAKEWLRFSVFKQWADQHYFEGSVLDKDLYDPTSKHYSPETCTFITQAINQLVQYKTRVRATELPTGVSLTSPTNRKPYRATIRVDGKFKHIGTYHDIIEAEGAYLVFKSKLMVNELNRNVCSRICTGLKNHINVLEIRFFNITNGGQINDLLS